MVLTFAALTTEPAIVANLWQLGAVVVLLASGLGFVAGLLSARWNDKRARERARIGLNRIFQTTLAALDSAHSACTLLDQQPLVSLRPEQTAQLDQKQRRLVELVASILQRCVPQALPVAQAAPPPVEPIDWVMEPVDPASELPARAAFEASLARLLESLSGTHQPASLLLVRIDRYQSLSTRFERREMDRLVRKLGLVICRAARDSDLVGRYGPDVFGVLMPGCDVDAGCRRAEAIRDSVRSHHFRVDEDGREIFLTASFGYTLCRHQDNADLILNRASDALAKSQRLGRNQLHMHDGAALVHCAAS